MAILVGEMPAVTADHGSEPNTAPPAERLVELAALLEATAADLRSTVRGPETLHHLRTTVRHLHVACDELANAAAAMAYRAGDAVPGAPTAEPDRRVRAIAWRLHYLSNSFRVSRDACEVVDAAADGFEAWLRGERRDPQR